MKKRNPFLKGLLKNIFFVVFIFNLVGEALRDALDPRLRQ